MEKKSLTVMLSMLLGMGVAQAETSPFLHGQLRVEDDPRFGISGIPIDSSVYGTIGNGVFTVGSPVPLFGANWHAHSGRVFGPGTYTFDVNKNNRGDLSGLPYEQVVVGPGQVGGHVLIDYKDYTDIDAIFVWDVIDNGDGTTTFKSVDAPSASPLNPDGLDGFLTREGPLKNASANFDFTIPTPTVPVTQVQLPPQPHSPDTMVLNNVANVDEGVAMVQAKLESEGFSVNVIQHSRGAAQGNVIAPPNVLISARPPRSVERRLLSLSDTIGIDLPMKFHLFQDEEGKVRLDTNSMGYLLDRHGVRPDEGALKAFDKFNEQFGKEDRGLVTVQSKRSFDDTVAALREAMFRVPNTRIVQDVDYGKDFSDDEREHRNKPGPVLIGFGSPTGAAPLLMQVERRLGLDLPLKVLVWVGDDGKVNITTNDIAYMAERYNITGFDNLVELVQRVVDDVVNAGAGLAP